MPTGTDRTPAQNDVVVAAYRAGLTFKQIAETLGVSISGCKLALRRAGEPSRSSSEAARKYKVEERYFAEIDTEEKAYWLGFIGADGCVYNKRLTISLADVDHGHLRKFSEAISAGTLPIRRSTPARRSPRSLVKTLSPVAAISCRSEILAADLMRVGVTPNKSTTLVPWNGCFGPLGRHYWRGMVDGDGCLSEGGGKLGRRLGLVGSALTIEAFQQFMRTEVGTEAAIRPHTTSPTTWCFDVGGMTGATAAAWCLYSRATVFLDRKQQTADRWFKTVSPPGIGIDAKKRRMWDRLQSAMGVKEGEPPFYDVVRTVRFLVKHTTLYKTDIAELFRMRPGRVSGIVSGRYWAHVSGSAIAGDE